MLLGESAARERPVDRGGRVLREGPQAWHRPLGSGQPDGQGDARPGQIRRGARAVPAGEAPPALRADLLVLRGQGLRGQGDLKLGRGFVRSRAGGGPALDPGHRFRGDLQMRSGRLSEAEKLVAEGLALAPVDADDRCSSGVRGNAEQALAVYGKALDAKKSRTITRHDTRARVSAAPMRRRRTSCDSPRITPGIHGFTGCARRLLRQTRRRGGRTRGAARTGRFSRCGSPGGAQAAHPRVTVSWPGSPTPGTLRAPEGARLSGGLPKAPAAQCRREGARRLAQRETLVPFAPSRKRSGSRPMIPRCSHSWRLEYTAARSASTSGSSGASRFASSRVERAASVSLSEQDAAERLAGGDVARLEL